MSVTREALGQIGSSDRHRFVGEFARYGTKRGWEGAVEETVLLKNIRLAKSSRQVANHIWLNRTAGWDDAIYMDMPQDAELKGGELVAFTARVAEYTKGYQGYREDVGRPIREDWKLERPTKFCLVSPQLPNQADLLAEERMKAAQESWDEVGT